ncbi:Hypothetical Protein FCC1311_001102 [Hondaea fermentalgiana]|uniref:Uncharacterized protein n=1 Tax=Hondaea fermentalgiana TaxID=2315210 RepID=A0A2R5G776_9STRA|nr:Hypothetical Protein FCC1311_001102 [Hondaea fermentalgiana]|eukprot:GBG23891.1 Hypothetical Protein FCC1311_001102 [Hondaea fermentalgiana]
MLYHKRTPEAPPTYGVPSMEVMAMQIQKLSTDLQTMHASMRDRDEDQSYYSKQAFEKLSRMHQLITNKERQLMDRIAAVQEHLGTVDQTGRENGERRIRLAEEKTEMVKQAFEKRAGMAEMGVARERRERIEAEERIRADVRAKLEQFASTIRDNEALVKSVQTRANQSVQELQTEHLKSQQTLKDHLQDALVTLANRIKSLQTAHKQAETRAEDKTREATKQVSDMLKAEIKVRKSALAKVAEALAQHETLVRHDIAQIAANVHAKQELHGCKLEESEAAANTRHEAFAKDTEARLAALQRDRDSIEETMHNHVADLGTRIESLQSSLAAAQKTFSNEVRELSTHATSSVQALRADVFEKLAGLEDRMMHTLEERMSKFERLLSNEQLDRHQHCQNVKNEVTDQLKQLRLLHAEQDKDVRAELAQTREHVLSVLDESSKTLQASLQSSSDYAREHIERVAASAYEATAEVDRSAREALGAQAAQQKALQERIDSVHADLAAADDCAREEILALGKDVDVKLQRTSNRLDGVYGDLQREIDRATNKDLELAGSAAAARADLQTAISESASRLSATIDAKLEQERVRASAYTDAEVSTARETLAASIEAEANSRTAAVRGMHEDLSAAIAAASAKLQQGADENLAAARASLESALRDQDKAHSEGTAQLSTVLEASAHSLRVDIENARQELNVRAALDTLCAKVERESALAQIERQSTELANLREESQSDTSAMRALIAAEAATRETALQTAHKETKSALDALAASHNERFERMQAEYVAIKTETDKAIDTVREEVHEQNTEMRKQGEDQHASLFERVEKLSTAVTSGNGMLEKRIDDSVAELREAVKNQEEAVEAAQETTSALSIQVDNLAAAMPDSKALAQRTESVYEELNEKLAAKQQDAGSLEVVNKRIGEMGEQLTGLDTWCSSAATFQTEIHGRVTSLEEAILLIGGEGLKTAAEVHSLENEATRVDSAVENLEQAVLLVGNEGLETAGEVRNLRNETEAVGNAVENLEEAVLLVGNEGLETADEVRNLRNETDAVEDAVGNLEEAVLLVGNEGLETADEVRNLENNAEAVENAVENLEEAVLLVGSEGLATADETRELSKATT